MKQRTLDQGALGGDGQQDIDTQLIHVVVQYEEAVADIADELVRLWQLDIDGASEFLVQRWEDAQPREDGA